MEVDKTQARSRVRTTNNWSEIQSKYAEIMNPDKLKTGDSVRIININSNEIEYGIISFETEAWREVQIGSEFKIFSYSNHKFVKHNE